MTRCLGSLNRSEGRRPAKYGRSDRVPVMSVDKYHRSPDRVAGWFGRDSVLDDDGAGYNNNRTIRRILCSANVFPSANAAQ